ncbi:hypothetical protein EON83_05450 [bacterium]|nr:MAG: hypothetical protein EON83_05450 [bacterium]
MFFLLDLAFGSINMIAGAISHLNIPLDQRQEGYSSFATWAMLFIGIGLFSLCVFGGIVAYNEETPKTPRSSINGIPLTEEDEALCSGPKGCPQGVYVKYMSRSR